MASGFSNFRIDAVQSHLRSSLQFGEAEADGDFLLNPDFRDHILAEAKREAAVLIGLVERQRETHVILTKRTEKLKSHSGQIAFPGGKIDAEDASPEIAALREAQEEIGLDTGEVEVVGRLPDYHTGSGFRIAPVLGIVSPDAGFEINPHEVEYMFEVPLQFLMDQANHQLSSRFWEGFERHYYEMPFEGHRIWGVTAGMIRVLHDRVFAAPSRMLETNR